MHVQLRQLEYFAAVAETRHFTCAAESVHVAQPSLSKQIRTLERELGTQLFRRRAATSHSLRPARHCSRSRGGSWPTPTTPRAGTRDRRPGPGPAPVGSHAELVDRAVARRAPTILRHLSGHRHLRRRARRPRPRSAARAGRARPGPDHPSAPNPRPGARDDGVPSGAARRRRACWMDRWFAPSRCACETWHAIRSSCSERATTCAP